MPGILPMKVIKLGTSAQSRIAQACDRCRSKKIRCDGVTPCCTQCANVGFECKTSDKLSRRAFPRGYTESLEERVRSLEQEVRELKDLLDEKDEKIDILSKIHSGSPGSRRTPSQTSSPPRVEEKHSVQDKDPPEDTFEVQQSPRLLNGEPDSYFMGASSGRAFIGEAIAFNPFLGHRLSSIDTFKNKVHGSGKPCCEFETDAFFLPCKSFASSPKTAPAKSEVMKAPPRLVSDQMINIFFQEWAPLFPVLHRPSFLNLYTEYITDPEHTASKHAVAQLNLVFGIAALSTEWNKQATEAFEHQWRDAVEAILPQNTLATLQCLILAQLYCVAKADFNQLLHYKGIAISLSHRLELHQSQKRFALGALTGETRKRVFWTLYTLDCFSAALLGLPMLLTEDDIHAEYPVDIDDENVSEGGFQPTLPGESTRLSSALALFRGSRILSRVLDQLYPASLAYDLSLQRIGMLNDELDMWLSDLPSHLRLQFVQDKPSTNVIGSRSPFLSLAYQYIRTLIHRPAVGSSLGARASSSVVALANSSKHIIQIIQLLEERRMAFTFCLNKNELLLLSGFALLYQGMDLKRRGKLMQDNQRLVCSVIDILDRNTALGSAEFQKLACSMISVNSTSKPAEDSKASSDPQKKAGARMRSPPTKAKLGRKHLQAITARFSTGSLDLVKKETKGEGSSTASTSSARPSQSPCHSSVTSVTSEPILPQHFSFQPNHHHHNDHHRLSTNTLDFPNLDYLSFGDNGGFTPSLPNASGGNATKALHTGDFTDCDLSSPLQSSVPLDNFFTPSDALGSFVSSSPLTTHLDWGSELWGLPPDTAVQPAASSVLSFTESELTSCEEWSVPDAASEFPGISMLGSELEAFVARPGA
ncbi:MAG: hypothetical protein Q9197_006081 [Variospora fuerteventurae]